MGMLKSKVHFPLLIALVCWGAAFVLACRLTKSAEALLPPADSVLGRLLGSSREVMSQRLYEEADNYFHSGVKHTQKAAFTSLFGRWAGVIAPSVHHHVEGVGVYELLPWFRFATEMDPHNVEVYLTASFWLASEGGRPDLAEKVLLEGQRNNPLDYRILQEKGLLMVREKKDVPAALALDLGLKLWPGKQDPQDVQVRLDLGQMLTLRAFLYEVNGQRDQALVLLRWAVAQFPQNKGLAERVAAMEKGEDTTAWARDLWTQMFARKTTCSREEEHDHDHDHEHEHDHE